jgi:protein-disulfide isomerase
MFGLDMKRLKQLLGWILISVMLFSCAAPSVNADSKIDPKLEEQVLQIIRKNPNVILEAVQSYQENQQKSQQENQQKFVRELQQNPKAIVGQSPVKGAPQSKVVLVEFSDFQCPYCGAAANTVKQFMEKRKNDVTFVYKHLPLTSIHAEALPAAKAAWAAQQQGKFWEFHDALFSQQKGLGDAFYQETAKKLGLDLAKFNSDRASKAADDAIKQDTQIAEKLGISGTPFFIMNGNTLSGAVELSELEAAYSKSK